MVISIVSRNWEHKRKKEMEKKLIALRIENLDFMANHVVFSKSAAEKSLHHHHHHHRRRRRRRHHLYAGHLFSVICPKKNMSLDNIVLQLFCCYYSRCT
jgi:hypothetical protein